MTEEQFERFMAVLERIADALEGIDNMFMSITDEDDKKTFVRVFDIGD